MSRDIAYRSADCDDAGRRAHRRTARSAAAPSENRGSTTPPTRIRRHRPASSMDDRALRALMSRTKSPGYSLRVEGLLALDRVALDLGCALNPAGGSTCSLCTPCSPTLTNCLRTHAQRHAATLRCPIRAARCWNVQCCRPMRPRRMRQPRTRSAHEYDAAAFRHDRSPARRYHCSIGDDAPFERREWSFRAARRPGCWIAP